MDKSVMPATRSISPAWRGPEVSRHDQRGGLRDGRAGDCDDWHEPFLPRRHFCVAVQVEIASNPFAGSGGDQCEQGGGGYEDSADGAVAKLGHASIHLLQTKDLHKSAGRLAPADKGGADKREHGRGGHQGGSDDGATKVGHVSIHLLIDNSHCGDD